MPAPPDTDGGDPAAAQTTADAAATTTATNGNDPPPPVVQGSADNAPTPAQGASSSSTQAVHATPATTMTHQWTPQQDLLLLRAIARRTDLNEHGPKVWTRLLQDLRAYNINGHQPSLEETMQRCYRLRWSEQIYDATWKTFPGALHWKRPFANANGCAPPLHEFAGGSELLRGEGGENGEDEMMVVGVKRAEQNTGEGGQHDNGGANVGAAHVAAGGAAGGQGGGNNAPAQGQAALPHQPQAQAQQQPQAQVNPQQPQARNAAAPRTNNSNNKREPEYLVEADNKRVRLGAPLPKGSRLVFFPHGEVHVDFR